MNRRQRFALETRGALEAWLTALVDVAAFIFTLGYINHIATRGQCRHCHR